MLRSTFPRVFGLVCLLWAHVASAATTPKVPLQLDADPSGDLLLYSAETGVWFSTNYSPGTTDGFTYVAGQWEPGLIVIPTRLNNDVLGDAFLYNPSNGAYSWAINTGTGYTRTNRAWSPGWRLFAADFNRDRLHDFLLYNIATGQWFQCLNNGAIDFTYNAGQWPAGREIVTGDFNGDERTDVFSYDPATGAFSHLLVAAGGVGFGPERHGTWSPGWQIVPVTLNLDTLTDLFLYNPASGVWFQLVSTNTDALFTYYGEQWSPGWRLFPADLDGDGVSDLFLYRVTTGAWFQSLTRSGGGGFVSYIAGAWSPGWQVYVTDFNQDRLSDLFLYSREAGTYVRCINTRNGQYQFASGLWSPGWLITSEIDRVEPPVPTLTITSLLAFGDSITFGSHSRDFFRFERDHAGYPGTLETFLRERYPQQNIRVTNAGNPGELILNGKDRLAREIETLRPEVVLLLEGVNDLISRSPGTVGQDLRQAVQRALARRAKVLIATLTPVTSTFDPNGRFTERILGLNLRIDGIAMEFNLGRSVDLYGAFRNDPSFLGRDGLHPSDAGYRQMAEAFFDAIVERYQTLR